MKKLILILGIASIFIFSIYYQKVFEYYSSVKYEFDFNNPLYLWGDISNCFTYFLIAFVFYSLGKDEEIKIKWLGYYAVANFWIVLVLTYAFNYIFNQSIQFHRVIICLISSLTLSLICYFISLIKFRSPRLT